MTGLSRLRIDGRHLWDCIMSMAEIGPGERGDSCRLALTDEDRQARDLLVHWSEEIVRPGD